MTSRPEQAVVFLHIGRAGGTTLARILERQYPADAVHAVAGLPTEATHAAVAALPADRRAAIRLLHGHLAFGAHELLPEPVTYVTVLREPVDRLLSHYQYVLRRPGHPLHRRVTRGRLSFRAYLESDLSLELDNWQTRVISGDLETPLGRLGEAALERAKANILDRFAVAGLLERFDETLILGRRRFGWRLPVYARRNANRGRVPRAAFPISDIEAAAAASRLDCELYAWAEARFAAALADAAGIEDDLRALRLANAVYQPWGRVRSAAADLRRALLESGRRETVTLRPGP